MIPSQCFSRVAKIFKTNISSIKLRYKRFICIKMLLLLLLLFFFLGERIVIILECVREHSRAFK